MHQSPSRFISFALVVISAIAGCGGGGSGANDGAAGGMTGSDGAAGAVASDDAATIGDSGGLGDAAIDSATSPDGAWPIDTRRTDTAMPAMTGLPAAGDHFCQHDQVEAAAWALGWQRHCVMTVANTPPLTMAQKQGADYACTFYDANAKIVADCPRTEVVAYCTGATAGAGTKAYTLIQKSNINPDAETVAVNSIGHGCLPNQIFDVDGKSLARACQGTVTAKVNGVLMQFSKVFCTYKTDGVRSLYFVEGDTPETNRLQLSIKKENGVVAWDTGIAAGTSQGAGYLEGGNNAFTIPVDAAARTVQATTFADKGASLVATFSLGDYKNGSGQIRTITEGTIDIKIVAP